MSKGQRALKRGFDLAAAAIGLLLLWPVILACALVAYRDTGAFGIYRQRRVGLHGRPFHVMKIRTMWVGSDTSNLNVTVDRDPRITPSGRWLRKLKLDELPQLWNVLVGHMSFVGPRPDVPGYADRLTERERHLLELRPGITGPATLKYRHEEALLARQADPVVYNDQVLYPDKVRLNLHYLEYWRFADDLRYILLTLHLAKIPERLDPPVPDGRV